MKTNMRRTTFTTKGQIVIPKVIRDRLGLVEGRVAVVEADHGRIILHPINPQPSIHHHLELITEDGKYIGHLWRYRRPSLEVTELQLKTTGDDHPQ
jgi:AbrB family looped-hinge helix DNA binding protein